MGGRDVKAEEAKRISDECMNQQLESELADLYQRIRAAALDGWYVVRTNHLSVEAVQRLELDGYTVQRHNNIYGNHTAVSWEGE